MSVAERLAGKRICICAGSGGVGKTTASAALAMGLAARGHKVAVVTIDPAKRLATSLGLERLGNEPRLVDPRLFADQGLEMRGELWAMMLDAKRTFDDLITRLAPDPGARDDVLRNHIYQELSSAVAGSQEFTAIAKLYELDRDGDFDVLVLDTPPSRNALDFLDAPARLTQFFEGRALRVFLAPTGLGARLVGRGTSLVFAALARVTGVDLLADLSTFFRALAGLIDGFRERAASVDALLRDPATAFLIVSSPEREPVEEAIFFAARLADAGMPLGGLIVNRVHEPPPADADADGVATALGSGLGESLARRVADSFAEYQLLAGRDRDSIARLMRELGDDDPVLIPELDDDVQDIAGLIRVHRHLFAAPRERATSGATP